MKRLSVAAVLLVCALCAIWGWFYWGWRSEQESLASLGVSAYKTEPLVPWLRKRAGPAGFVLDRVAEVKLFDRPDITDIRAASVLSYLRVFVARNIGAADLTPLSALSRLESIHLSDMPVLSVAPLKAHSKLQRLYLKNLPVADLSPVAELGSLRFLWLESLPEVRYIPSFHGPNRIEQVFIWDTRIDSLASLPDLVTLRELTLSNTGTRDIRPIASLVNLRKLQIVDCPVDDISAIGGLVNLDSVDLSRTLVRDIAPLHGLAKLARVRLRGTQVENATPLLGLGELRQLCLPREHFSDSTIRYLRWSFPSECHITAE